MARKKVTLERRLDTLVEQKAALDDMYSKTNAKDVDSFVQMYFEAEESTSRLYSAVQDLNSQASALEEQIAGLERETKVLHGSARALQSNAEAVTSLKLKLETEQNANETWAAKNREIVERYVTAQQAASDEIEEWKSSNLT